MYNICKKMILNGNYEKEDMMNKLDIYLLKNRITEEQYLELVGLINNDSEKL